MSPDDKAREAIRLTLEWDERRGYLMPYAVRDKLRLAYESAKQKGEAEGCGELAAACPTIVKAGKKLTADRVSGKVVVGCYGDVPAIEFKRLAAMLSAGGEG